MCTGLLCGVMKIFLNSVVMAANNLVNILKNSELYTLKRVMLVVQEFYPHFKKFNEKW